MPVERFDTDMLFFNLFYLLSLGFIIIIISRNTFTARHRPPLSFAEQTDLSGHTYSEFMNMTWSLPIGIREIDRIRHNYIGFRIWIVDMLMLATKIKWEWKKHVCLMHLKPYWVARWCSRPHSPSVVTLIYIKYIHVMCYRKPSRSLFHQRIMWSIFILLPLFTGLDWTVLQI